MAPTLPIDLRLDAVCCQYGVARLALFGSTLREDFSADSDNDVLCTLQPDSPVMTLMDGLRLKQAMGSTS